MVDRTTSALWATRAMAGFQLAVGFYQAASPIEGASGFLGTTSFDHRTASPLMRAVAGRNISSGIIMTALTTTSHWNLAGLMMMCGLVTQACDTLACLEVGGSWKGHAFLAPFTAGIGWWIYKS